MVDDSFLTLISVDLGNGLLSFAHNDVQIHSLMVPARILILSILMHPIKANLGLLTNFIDLQLTYN